MDRISSIQNRFLAVAAVGLLGLGPLSMSPTLAVPLDQKAAMKDRVPMAPAPPEYDFKARTGAHSGAPSTWEAQNLAQDLRVVFEASSMRVLAGTELARGWEEGFTLSRYGFAGRTGPAGVARQSPYRNHMALFLGDLSEWCSNEEKGIRHGVTLSAPPEGGTPEDGSPLVVEFDLTGTLSAKVSRDGQVIEFFASGGEQVLRSEDLRAVDAEGREVAALVERIELQAGGRAGLRFVLESIDHTYPLTVSLLTRSSWLTKWKRAGTEPAAVPLADRSPSASPHGSSAADREPGPDGVRIAGALPESGPGGSSARTLDGLPSPPPNDICQTALGFNEVSNRQVLSPTVSDISGATTTGDPIDAPSCAFGGGPVSRSVWFRFTAGVTGTHIVSTCSDAPTATTVSDTVLAIYTSPSGCSGPFTEIMDGCDDDSCIFKDQQGEAVTNLTAGTTYYIVVWQFGTDPPPPGTTAVQVRIIEPSPVPSNDTCAAPRVLVLDSPVTATVAGGADDYELSGAACFTGIGQTASTAPGRDVAYSFTAPTAGSYSFRAQNLVSGGNPVLYVATSCPAATPGTPVTVGTCLGASNRGASAGAFSAEEVMCLPLAAGQGVFVFVDEGSMTITGGSLRLEVSRCAREAEPNDTPAGANATSCGIEGTISSAGDADFFVLGPQPAGSRLFAMVDGVAGNSTDFDMRVTTSTDTLEFDDLDAGVAFGSLSPTVAGTKMTGVPTYIRMSHHSAASVSEPYRLYTVVQPPSGSASSEVEPNGTIGEAQRNSAANNYFHGQLPGPSPSTDVDLYPFTAAAGQLIVLGVDGDPGLDGTAVNTALALLDSNGAILAQSNDPDAFATLRTPVLGSVTSTVPVAPAEALEYRVSNTGTYYARVMIGTDQPDSTGSGDYLLSISKNCTTGGGGLSADVSLAMTGSPDPVTAGGFLTYTLTVSNAGPADASGVVAAVSLPGAGVSFVSTSGPCQEGSNAVPHCTLGLLAAGDSKQYTIAVRVNPCIGSGSLLAAAVASTTTPDSNGANESMTVQTAANDPGACDDGNSCTASDHCSAGTCVGTPLTPAEASDLRIQTDKATLAWTAASASTSSDVARGRVGEFPIGAAVSASTGNLTFTTSACPAAGPVSDDFRTGVLNTALWAFVNPLADGSFSLTTNGADKVLNLILPSGNNHDVWTGGDQAIRIMQAVSNVDFEIEVKWMTLPSVASQLQGIIVEESPGNYLRFDIFHDGTSPRILAASFVSNSPTIETNTALPGVGAPVWMRVKRVMNTWTESYSTDGTSFTPAASFSRTLTVKEVGPFAGNFQSSPPAPAFTSAVDYFFNTATPISPEDSLSGMRPLAIASGPPVISGAVAAPSAFGSTISWTTDIPATSRVDFGTTTAYGSAVSDPSLVTSHSAPLTGLNCNTVYEYTITSTGGAGASETCLASALAGTSKTDSVKPPVGAAFWYLVRGRNSCGSGPYGFASNGTPEVTGACP